MWFVLPFSPLGEKRGVLFCFGVSFSHIHHHAILLLLLANASLAFVLGEANFPWNWYSSWEDPLKQVTFIIPRFPATLVSAAPPCQLQWSWSHATSWHVQASWLCTAESHQADLIYAYENSLWRWLHKIFTSVSVLWLLMNWLNLEKSSPSSPTASVVALALLYLPHFRHFQCCISFGVKVIPLLFISVTGTLTFSNTNRHWNGLWSNYWPLGKKREEEALLGCLSFFMAFYIFQINSFL